MKRLLLSPPFILSVLVAAVLLGGYLWSSHARHAQPAKNALATPQPAPLETTTLEIRKHDTIVSSLLKNDIPSTIAHEIVSALRKAGANLRKIRPGDTLELAHAPDGQLVNLAYAASPWVRYEVSHNDGGWQSDRIEIEPEVRVEVRQGEVKDSLWSAIEASNISPQSLLDFVRIFESDFDFTADTQTGDRFRLLIETRYANGEAVEQGRILAAQYLSDGRTLTAIGFPDKDKFAYYDPDGQSLNKLFLRSPLEFSRISSGFTYRRPHPVLGGVRPHLAIDYAAPTGTPVWAVADGVVEFAGRKGGNGIQVLLRHRGGYKTYYNHLSRIASGLRSGSSVNQKQIIGYVGSTGISTGPHLDYRVSHNDTFVNPLGEKFLPGKSIDPAQRTAFTQHAQKMLARLQQEAPLLQTTQNQTQRSST